MTFTQADVERCRRMAEDCRLLARCVKGIGNSLAEAQAWDCLADRIEAALHPPPQDTTT